jgi:ribonucleoside-triphosphate reductase (thioredoxin)
MQPMTVQLELPIQWPKEPSWGPNGKDVYERTYQRVKSDGTRETWPDTVRRVVKGNLSLVPENRIRPGEEEELYDLIYNFRGIPAGRHLWMSGVDGRQFLFNCYVSGWGDRLSEHFTFTFNQLMEGGGVGANYSAKYLNSYTIYNLTRVHIVCSEEHENYRDLQEAGLLSSEFSASAMDAFEVEDSREGWTAALRWVIDIASSPTYEQEELTLIIDVSNVRAAGKRIKTFGGTSAGPVPFARMVKQIGFLLNEMWENGVTGPLCMEADHAIATCVVSGNVRRSARMAIMHWNDPYIEWFLSCKEEGLSHWSTNISVEIDDEFIEYVNRPSNDGDPLADRARRVYESIASGMLNNGEPGIWNSSLANVGEPNAVIATNPCGEICLEPWENCNLGHINLDSFVDPYGYVDFDGLTRAHELMARFLLRATYGDISDPKTKAVANRNRRIGVGHFGYAGFVAKQGIKFSESHRNLTVRQTLSALAHVVQNTVERYAHELRIPVPVKSRTVAPTGTIAKLAGRTEGIHPIYARYFIQRIRYSTVDPQQAERINEYRNEGFNVVPDTSTPYTMVVELPTKNLLVEELEKMGIDVDVLEDASEISLADHLGVQSMYQELWADNAVSYTVNLDPKMHTTESLARVMKPFLGVLKGTTVFPERGYELAPMERVGEADFVRLRGSQAVSEGINDDCATGACPVR